MSEQSSGSRQIIHSEIVKQAVDSGEPVAAGLLKSKVDGQAYILYVTVLPLASEAQSYDG
jgi:hypothetical protein